jgi:hypothetical protein
VQGEGKTLNLKNKFALANNGRRVNKRKIDRRCLGPSAEEDGKFKAATRIPEFKGKEVCEFLVCIFYSVFAGLPKIKDRECFEFAVQALNI